MHTDRPESVQALGRLLANENSASDLLAVLAELDDRALATAFGLPTQHRYEIRREVAAGSGRLDVVVIDVESKLAVAAVEMKGASDLHGDQLDRYLTWANGLASMPKLFLCAFDSDEQAANPAWARISLKEVFSAWKESEHLHAAWLANAIVTLLDAWDGEADGPIGERIGYYVPDVLTKRLAREVHERLSNRRQDQVFADAYRDKGGSPMILAWVAHPRDPSDDTVRLGVDLRSPIRRSKSTMWRVRPFVQVNTTSQRGLKDARALAFKLASDIHRAMGYQHISEELEEKDQAEIAKALSVRRYDGFNRPISDFDFQAWGESIDENARYPRTGVFFHDKGRRLATILDVDVKGLTRHDLADMVLSVIEILDVSAKGTVLE